MDDPRLAAIQRDPTFVKLVAIRGRFRWRLTAILLVGYFGFVFATAFGHAPATGAVPHPMMSRLIVPMALILLPVVLTGVYVLRANLQFDRLTDTVLKDVQ